MPSPYLGFVDVQAHEFVELLLCRFCHPVARMTSLFCACTPMVVLTTTQHF